MRIAILDDIHRAWENTDGVRRLRERAEVKIFTEPFGSPAALRGFDALVANRERTKFTRALLEQLVDVRVIAQTGNHAAHMDFAAAHERGIVVAQASGGYSIGAAELAIGLAIAVMRQIPRQDAAVRRGDWHTPSTPVLHGKTLGAVGLGRVGTHVARIAKAFGMRVLGWSPKLTEPPRRPPARSAASSTRCSRRPTSSRSSVADADVARLARCAAPRADETDGVSRQHGARPDRRRGERSSRRSRHGASRAPASTFSTRSRCRPAIR